MEESVCEGVGVGMSPAVRQLVKGAEVLESIGDCMSIAMGREAINWVFNCIEVAKQYIDWGVVVVRPGRG